MKKILTIALAVVMALVGIFTDTSTPGISDKGECK